MKTLSMKQVLYVLNSVDPLALLESIKEYNARWPELKDKKILEGTKGYMIPEDIRLGAVSNEKWALDALGRILKGEEEKDNV